MLKTVINISVYRPVGVKEYDSIYKPVVQAIQIRTMPGASESYLEIQPGKILNCLILSKEANA